MKEITQNELNSPEAPGDGWYIIEATGQHPHGEIMQNLTPAVLARVAAAGVPDLSLVRAFSEGGKAAKKARGSSVVEKPRAGVDSVCVLP